MHVFEMVLVDCRDDGQSKTVCETSLVVHATAVPREVSHQQSAPANLRQYLVVDSVVVRNAINPDGPITRIL
jgi:hypothetical protein